MDDDLTPEPVVGAASGSASSSSSASTATETATPTVSPSPSSSNSSSSGQVTIAVSSTAGSNSSSSANSSTVAVAGIASASTSSSTSASDSLSSTDSNSTTSDDLTACLKAMVLDDFDYALCLMNSGFFALNTTNSSKTAASSASSTLWVSSSLVQAYVAQLVASNVLASSKDAGTCRLLCTDPSNSASSSCCEAAVNAESCASKSNGAAGNYCQELVGSMLSLDNQCDGSSAADIALIAVSALVLCVIAAVFIFARRHKKQLSNVSFELLESRFALSSNTRSFFQRTMTSWRQIMNLVRKNLIIRRRKPVAFVMEQLMPVLLVTGLVFLANLDSIFGSSSSSTSTSSNTSSSASLTTSQASSSTTTIMCTGLNALNEQDLGAPNTTMTAFYTSGQSVLGMFLLISYIKFVSTTTTNMVYDKETRIREVMKIMGLSDSTLLWSWFVTNFIVSTPLAFVIAAELKYGNVLPSAEYGTLVFLFWSLGVAIVGFSYCIAPFFSKSRTASIASVLIWLICFFPFYSVQSGGNAPKYWAALLPPTAFALATDDLLQRAYYGTGMAYEVAFTEQPITVPTAFTMSCFLILDTLLLICVGWYLEQVIPQQFGVRKPWNFMFQKKYWGWCTRVSSRASNKSKNIVLSPAIDMTSPRVESVYSAMTNSYVRRPQESERSPVHKDTGTQVETVGASLAAQELKGTCLQIRGLRKVFEDEDGKTKIAVKKLDLTMYSGHITALLGHNGAGKTTTISMLTGLIAPTAGDATLFGRSLKKDFHELRQIMGICPQHDVLLNDLTVEEHLRLFGTMKNVPPNKLDEQVEKMIQDVGLTEKRKVRSKDLSGGQKRKLSVAMAFIGDSKLVFLDEPTSGMDPYSRRFTWNLLQRNREDRVIVLTTHFMDEADILGDRIAIMADGQLRCAGSSLFLKNRYGAGYNLTMIKGPNCDIQPVTNFLRRYVPEVTCSSSYGSEIVFQLPSSSSSVFSAMLQDLDANMDQLRLVQYGISVTTLEQVFLRIARDEEHTSSGTDSEDMSAMDHIRETSMLSRPTSGNIPPTQTFQPTFWKQYCALLTKRIRITRRDRKSLLNSIFIPLLLFSVLFALPEIKVASFLPTYAQEMASPYEQESCSAANFSMVSFSTREQDRCTHQYFAYCKLGVIDCDTTTCCDKFNAYSPYYACNTCERSVANPLNPKVPCYNQQCLARGGAKLQVTINAFLISIVTMLAFAFIPASIVAFIVREKNPIQDAKSLQLICGANVSAYWLSCWTHDILISAVSVLVAVIVIPLSNRAFASPAEVMAVILLVGAHALVMIPLAYRFSFRFKKHAAAQTSLLVFGLGTGGLLSIFSFLCRVIDFRLGKTSSSITLADLDRNFLRWIFMLFPGYSMTNGLSEIAIRKLSRNSIFGSSTATPAPSSFFGMFKGLGTDANCTPCWNNDSANCCVRSAFDVDVATAPIVYMLLEALVLMLLVYRIETRRTPWDKSSYRWLSSIFSSGEKTLTVREEDDDVAAERERIEDASPSPNDAIFIRNLRHQYANGAKVALHNLNLAIPKGECFGYLGINGAGKSTTLKVLTGSLTPSSGFVSLGGYDLATETQQARTVLGYCPQFDALHDLLTVSEQLELYARLKGIPSDLVDLAVDQKINEVGLQVYRDTLTRGLSGGNKRKVSTAIALMGSPRIIILDEPSTGVDPSSRRKMWDVIAAVCAEKESSVVLTTHNMEECEALCTRVGILVSGKMQCLGSVEHLKQKFGRGFTVDVKLREPEPALINHLHQELLRITGTTSLDTENRAITADSVADICASLGEPDRARRIQEGEGNGWILSSYLTTSGFIPIDIFCAWWASETQSDALRAFLARECVGSQLVEHQGDHFRFQVPKHDSLRPFAIFAVLEQSKPQLRVEEYSVSETSLEHIFNTMAAEQDEERALANGLYAETPSHARAGSLHSVRSYSRHSLQ